MDELAKKRAAAGVTDDQIAQLKNEHGGAELRAYNVGAAQIVCKQPSRAEYKRFRTMYLDPGQRPMALEALLFGCVVYPDRTVMGSLLEDQPALPETVGEKLASWAGLGAEVVEKKL